MGGVSRWPHAARTHRNAPAVTALAECFDLADAKQIELVLARAADDGFEMAARLSWRLRLLVQRSIPPRAIEAAPVPRAARLRFADGTTVVVHGTMPGDLGILAIAMKYGSVKPTACSLSPEGNARLSLAWPGANHRLSLDVVGLDQPD